MEEIGVSILCLAYNHENYIKDAIEGFLQQKTTFPFEIIINEDASTDNTAKMIQEYENRYPDKVKVIYHKKNTYSQGININKEFMLPLARGKYIALCDGDDYWTDPLKLQKQYDAMEANPNCYMCLHRVREINVSAVEQTVTFIPRNRINTGIMTSREFLGLLGKSNFFNEVCYFFRRKEYVNYQNNYPEFASAFMKNKTDDAPMLLYFGQLGDVYYLDEDMAAYRHYVAGSWSDGLKKADRESFIRYCTNAVNAYLKFNEFTNNKYSKEFAYKISYFKFKIAEAKHDYASMLDSEFKEVMQRQGRKYRTRIKLLNRNKFVFTPVFKIYDCIKKLREK